jgi:hypothetical protein
MLKASKLLKFKNKVIESVKYKFKNIKTMFNLYYNSLLT